MSSSGTNDFTVPNQSQLNNLAEGCYVRIQENSAFYWVEIDEVNSGGELTGTIHSRLEGSTSQNNLNDQARVCFTRDQVTHVGCDRFCFC